MESDRAVFGKRDFDRTVGWHIGSDILSLIEKFGKGIMMDFFV